ncbi:unnamed protein product [Schistocephalus solidus]|uniref:Helitron_like_N domain-containing protein n=1 Tax=Schistocephalus solidus TaxID=70667 RepID=A0A183SLM1_SCHSO|nr:unnamed protein product [Schistocephalus solidus]
MREHVEKRQLTVFFFFHRELLQEAWDSTAESINRHFDLPAAYQALREQINGADEGPTRQSRRFGMRINVHNVAIHRRDRLSFVFAHALEFDHSFKGDGTEVIVMANNKYARDFLETLSSSTTSINHPVDLDPHYEGLHARLTQLRRKHN